MLSLREVTKTYETPDGPMTVLTVDEFDMEAGQAVALIGPSGSGKSTLLNIIAGISRPTTGNVTVKGIDVTGLRESQLDRYRAEHIGYVFQNFNLLQGYSALENLMLAMQFGGVVPKAERKRKALRLLEQVNLGHRVNHVPSRMSNGEQQRVAIARALINAPALVLADEPTASLDPENGKLIVSMLTDLCQSSGAGLLLCTHDMTIAESLGKRMTLGKSQTPVRQEGAVS
ncbi:ABC transporter ATP-binding protein [Paenibacillus turpanensis]|uniref:ABC transporter ATP-binding protein n=1 Tax=Paenibacillus turpanensis TaxID=2689078 RepID=UPI00140C1B49|nr:ABC transporter ATP-binding protein [Paenibacillus turpanensis]